MWVFVYGTLLPGESNHAVALPYLEETRPGRVRGRLYNVGDLYPALVPDAAAGWVIGDWLRLRKEALPLLDALEDYRGPGEDNEYERIRIEDGEAGLGGWVYVYPDSRGLPAIESGDWKQRTAVEFRNDP